MAEFESDSGTPLDVPPEMPVVEGRSCAGCTMCCKVMGVGSLSKPPQKWCDHCAVGTGCSIYETRPMDCREYYCHWLLNPAIGEHWAPKHSRMVLAYRSDRRQLTVYVDVDRPDAWRKAPYRADIQRWTVAAAKQNGQVLICSQRDVIRVLPDREQRLGDVRDVQLTTDFAREKSDGSGWNQMAVKRPIGR